MADQGRQTIAANMPRAVKTGCNLTQSSVWCRPMSGTSATTLQRKLGLLAAVAIVVANVIGTGVFLKARVMTTALGSPGWVMAAWVAAGLLSLAGALTYAELAAMMPETGGEFAYLNRGYGRLWGFLFGWTQVLVAKTGSQASAAVGFGIFLNSLVGGGLKAVVASTSVFGWRIEITQLQLVAVGVIALVTLLNMASVQFSGRVATVLAACKLLLILTVGLGAFFLAQGSWANFDLVKESGAGQGVAEAARHGSVSYSFASGFAAAMLAALWAYDGWNTVTLVAGEVAQPRRNLPLALIGGSLAIVLLYLLANAAYFYVLTPTEIAQVPAGSSVALAATERFLGAAAAGLLTAGLLASSLGTLHTSVMSGARVSYAMACQGLFWSRLGKVSPRTAVPVRALAFQGLWASLLALSGSFDVLTDYVVFGSWIFYGMAGAVVIILRRREPQADRPYRVWGYPWVPGIFLLTTGWLLFQTLKDGAVSALIGLALMATGLPVYWLLNRKPTGPLRSAAA